MTASDSNMLLEGANDADIGRAEGWVRDGRAEGFVLDLARRRRAGQARIAAEMSDSFVRKGAAANDAPAPGEVPGAGVLQP